MAKRKFTSKSLKNPLYDIDFYHAPKSKFDYGELQAVRRTLAKQANQRMVRLERATSKITGESYASFGAIDKVYDYLGDINRNRFSETKNAFKLIGGANPTAEQKQANEQTRRELLKEIKTLQEFLGSKTSLVSGQRNVEQRRIDTFEEKGIEFANTKEFYDFLNSETFKDATKKFDSETIVEEYDRQRSRGLTNEQIIDALADYRTKSAQTVKGMRKALNMINPLE